MSAATVCHCLSPRVLKAVGGTQWLWPIRETMRKTARTCATVLANMERFPDYK